MQLCAIAALALCGLALLPASRASRALRHDQARSGSHTHAARAARRAEERQEKAAQRVQEKEAPSTVNPVSGIVELLKGVKKQLEEEARADEEIWEKLDCWCTTNDDAKTRAISEAEAHLLNLATVIERNTALSASLTVEIQGLEKEIQRNRQSLDAATALRKSQHDEFIGDEKEMVQSIVALDAAITVLAKHHGEANSAASSAALAQAAHVARQHAALLQGRLSLRQRRAIEALAQQPGGYFDAAPTFKQAYQPQSGEIFGILREMKDTFEADLSASRRDEIDAQASYTALKAAKENQIQTGQAALRDKQQQLAEADDKVAQSKQDSEDTEASLSADRKFLVDLKLKCSMNDREWAERKKLRQAELAAVSEAIAVLSSDDARDLAGRTFNPATLLQTGHSLKESGSSRQRAASVLADIAAKARGTELAKLVTAVQIDPFTRVKKSIDDMVVQLLKEKELEVQHRDWCIEELNKNEQSVASETHAKATLESKIQGLELVVAGLNGTIETLKAEIFDLEVQQQRAKEGRELEHQEFSVTIEDQRKVQQLLTQALTIVQSVYGQSTALAQVDHGQHKQLPAEPQGFKDYEHHKAGGGVIAMIEHVIADAQAMEVATMHAETEAQDAYSEFVQETTVSVHAKQDSIVDKETELAQVKQDLVQAKSELEARVVELKALSDNAGALHGSCDFIMKSFETRQAARDEEVAALRKAKAYLSGMQL